jgi:hypothetical protein
VHFVSFCGLDLLFVYWHFNSFAVFFYNRHRRSAADSEYSPDAAKAGTFEIGVENILACFGDGV